jgi:hypothetical protein
MAGIVTPLKPYHGIGLGCKQVNDFSFAFIPPLGSQDDYIFIHTY